MNGKGGELFRLTSCRQLNYLDSSKFAEKGQTLPKGDFRTKHFLDVNCMLEEPLSFH